MQPNKTTTLTNWLESALVFCLGFGLFISKPVIYAASTALVLLFLLRIVWQADFRRTALGNHWITAGLMLYLLGLAATLIYPGQWPDISLYGRKALFLLLIGAMLLSCRQPETRAAGLIGLLLGFWVATGLTIYEMPWEEHTGRLHGSSWPVDTWGVLCGLFAVFLMPSIFSGGLNKLRKSLFGVTAMAALVFMLLSGSRGPMLAVGVAAFFYLLFAHRRILAIAVLAALVLYWPTKTLWPDRVNLIETRIASIGHGTLDESSWIRLHLWKLSIAQDQQKWADDPLVLLFGSGPENHIHEIQAFFHKTSVLTLDDKTRLQSWGYPGNDVHNMYLDSMAKMGVLWTGGVTLYLIGLLLVGWRARKRTAEMSAGTSLVIATFLIIGVFYDAMLHFNAVFMAYFASLALSARPSDQNRLD